MMRIIRGTIVAWKGDDNRPAMAEVYVPGEVKDMLCQALGISEAEKDRFVVLAEVCSHCGRKLFVHDEANLGIGVYKKPGGGVRMFFYSVCERCLSRFDLKEIAGNMERKAAKDGILPWLACAGK